VTIVPTFVTFAYFYRFAESYSFLPRRRSLMLACKMMDEICGLYCRHDMRLSLQ